MLKDDINDIITGRYYDTTKCLRTALVLMCEGRKRHAGGRKSRHPLFQTWERKSTTYCAPQCETIDYNHRTVSNALVCTNSMLFSGLLNEYNLV